MSTCVLYVDESGDVRQHDVPLKNGQTPIFTLTGLVLPLKEWRNIDREFLALKRTFFAPELTNSKKRAEHYEIKGNTLTSPRNKDSRRRHVFLNKICQLASSFNGKLFCVTIVKSPEEPTNATSIYTSSLQYLIERFNIFISEHESYDKGIIIADSTKQFDNDVAKSHMSFIFGTESGRSLNHIYEAPLFADSRLTAGLQMVDMLSSIIYTNHYHWYCRSVPSATNYEHMKKYWEIIKALEFKSIRKYDGYQKFGFRTIDHNR